ncbi:Hypothetical protein NTJ_13936 [Nesidiocoris tenuis]|uniref:Tetraspanin n=1 Tax=Nesidiocoris tenuis TaxID=355587 RepID=A0ABN7BBC2_9HEMI|nr:Hypothetical protein NTJ_13936 [Nesidiocoris tenuis]
MIPPLEIAFIVICGVDAAIAIIFTAASGLNNMSGSVMPSIVALLLYIAISAMGIFSVLKKKRGLQLAYMIVQIIIIVLGFLAVIGLIVICAVPMVHTVLKGLFIQDWITKMKDYPKNSAEVDDLQKKLKCCGLTPFKYNDTGYPSSCCEIPPCSNNVFPKSCDEAHVDNTLSFVRSAIGLLCVIIAVKIALTVLISLIRKRQPMEETEEDEE